MEHSFHNAKKTILERTFQINDEIYFHLKFRMKIYRVGGKRKGLLCLRNIEIKRSAIGNNVAVIMRHFDGASCYTYFAVRNCNLHMLVTIATG